ncbi:MAG: DUF4132 domain-containing protein [Planctomycetes bacterium]|nr:DUF4132 domain-containing protein [Planctomycetota bacterium]
MPLTPEAAKQRLAEIHVVDWEAQALKRVVSLPTELGQTVLHALNERGEERRKVSWEQRKVDESEAAQKLDAMNAGERRKAFAAIFPHLHGEVEGCWNFLKLFPYQEQHNRRPFRAPQDGKITASRRANWLQSLQRTVKGYDKDIAWFAAWAEHVEGAYPLGTLFASVIDSGGKTGDEVFNILCASAKGEHEIGRMGRHVTRALLSASREDGWEFVEKMLLAAQREEGLRQAILETVDEAHPRAFRRMLGVIMENDLARFSSVVRAANVWFGLAWDSVSVKVVNATFERVIRFLDDPAARAAALKGNDWEDFYFAAWCEAFEDAPHVVPLLDRALSHKRVEMRYTALYLALQLQLDAALPIFTRALDDEDMRVADRALSVMHVYGLNKPLTQDLFERIEHQFKRWTDTKNPSKPVTWPWTTHRFERKELASALLPALGERPATRLLPFIDEMAQDDRAKACNVLSKGGEADAKVRELILKLVGDPGSNVREAALKSLENWTIGESDVERLEHLLARKTNDLRRALLTLLSKRDDTAVLASAGRLLARGEAERLAGLELLRMLAEQKRSLTECAKAAAEFKAKRKRLSTEEAGQLEAIESAGGDKPTLDNALGLCDRAKLAKPPVPRNLGVTLMTPTAERLLLALDELVHEHRNDVVSAKEYSGSKEYIQVPLGTLGWRFPSPPFESAKFEKALAELPLRELWFDWWKNRPAGLRDPDGYELERAQVLVQRYWDQPYQKTEAAAQFRAKMLPKILGRADQIQLRYREIIEDLVEWLWCLDRPAGVVDWLLDAAETNLALCADGPHYFGQGVQRYNEPEPDWRKQGVLTSWIDAAESNFHWQELSWTPAQQLRLFGLQLALGHMGSFRRPALKAFLLASRNALASDHDIYDAFLGTRFGDNSFGELDALCGRKPKLNWLGLTEIPPDLQVIANRCRERVLEVELKRGEQPTAATQPAKALRYTGGLDVLARVVRALGSRDIKRGSRWGEDSNSREYVLSQLMRNTWPRDKDTPQALAAALPVKEIGEERLIEVAMFAPHWARHVEHALKWPGLTEAVWWVHAHTKDSNWSVEEDIREMWSAQISEMTALSAQDLMDGAVDVEWHGRILKSLGVHRFNVVLETAKLASSGSGHARAKLFANAMLGKEKRADLQSRIGKRQQDAIRALGLLPLTKHYEKEVLDRYKVIQEFVRTSRQFGSQRQASEKRAASIAMENLARTAGYADPLRLEWAMEAKAVADLAKGPIKLKRGDVEVALAIVAGGEPELTVTKSSKELKDIPAALKKDAKVVELRERRTELKRQASRMRKSLEGAMVRGDTFTGAELKTLFEHPVLAPMLSRLVLVGEHAAGYPEKRGQLLRNHAGKLEPVGAKDKLRIAHPNDLYVGKKWHLWQHDCFARELVQPFKQVFRELYLLTDAEKSSETFTRRYSGHQVQPKQALALLGGRGWVVRPEEGVSKTYHDAGVTAHLGFMEGFYTPAEIEGLTVENVAFSRRGKDEPVKLEDVPPRLFSEAMRDLDLVVSVAHRGGVDPEASASSIEMRSAIIRETCELLKINNVTLKGNFALIMGKLGDYSVHLGSAITHRMPGGMLFIVPVHAAHRGRIFLPFADEDPKAAEVLSKILLLARDHEIKDPNILDQMR